MARAYTPKVNKHVTWFTATGRPRPATITAVTSNTVVNLRVERTGETVVGAVKGSYDPTQPRASVWVPSA